MYSNLNDEDKELQIELEKLQADVKVYQILSISAAAFFGLLVISFLILSINAASTFQKCSFLVGMILSAILGFGFAALFTIKKRDKRREIEELKSRCR
jgi:phosphotransferase system  glucose/maltose/N-acetylglucosamine-specific IIC component